MWITHVFSTKAACEGGVVRRKIRDIERYVGLEVTARLLFQLPISFRCWSFCEAGTFDNIGEAGKAAPYNCRACWRIRGAIEISSEPCDRPDIEVQITRTLQFICWRRPLEQATLGFSEGSIGSVSRG